MITEIYQKLDKYPKRNKKKQKIAFLKFLETELSNIDYESSITTGRYLFQCRNLETECSEPEIILGAHYDTPTMLPFFFEPLFRIFGHTRQILMMICIFTLVGFLTPVVVHFPQFQWLYKAIEYTFFVSFLSLFIPNPQNRNDNTSGVAALLEIADRIADNEVLKNKVKFIFFDNEELGLLGSLMQKSKMKKLGYSLKNIKFVSLDCVGRGDVAVLAYHNKKNDIAMELNILFREIDEKARSIRFPYYPLSDNYAFMESSGVNISFMNKSFIPGGYYIKNVHSLRDVIIDYNKIDKTCDVVEKFLINNLEKNDNEQE